MESLSKFCIKFFLCCGFWDGEILVCFRDIYFLRHFLILKHGLIEDGRNGLRFCKLFLKCRPQRIFTNLFYLYLKDVKYNKKFTSQTNFLQVLSALLLHVVPNYIKTSKLTGHAERSIKRFFKINCIPFNSDSTFEKILRKLKFKLK